MFFSESSKKLMKGIGIQYQTTLEKIKAYALCRIVKNTFITPSIIISVHFKKCLNPNQHGLCGRSIARGGWNQDNAVFGLLRPHFSPKSTKHGLKWELECLSTYRISENHPMFCSFSVPWPWSSLVWARKFFSFRHENFWKFIIFDLHRQYVHQMKAENILNSNLTSKNTICYKKKS